MVLFLICGLFEAAIITAETFPSSISEKFFWTAINVTIMIGIPVGVISINKFSDLK
jgi:hypothetical protein